ncbi:MAG: hypothetical protein IBX69_10750 [Anaerolineales bacterium]|nr:hypothetical protein [Anaerolineales bacterium]
MADEKRLTQRERANRLNITERHFRRLLQRYRMQRPQEIISGHRRKPSNNSMKKEKEKRFLKGSGKTTLILDQHWPVKSCWSEMGSKLAR